MKWNDPPLDSVITKNVYYYDESKKATCQKICNKLEIDCFPDLYDNKRFWILDDNLWRSNKINYSVENITNPFDERLMDLFSINHSNIVFVSSSSLIDGIIHFTNYENEDIFSCLYRNIHLFEKSLRSHLISLNLNFEYLRIYFEKKRDESKRDSDIKYIEKILKRFKNNEFNENNPYQELDFGDLLTFSFSSKHDKDIFNKIGITKLKGKVKIDDIVKLRNTIMHSKQVSGEKKNTLFEFPSFAIFFKQVLLLKLAFMSLSDAMTCNTLDKKRNENLIKLELIDKMSDSEIKEYFYLNY